MTQTDPYPLIRPIKAGETRTFEFDEGPPLTLTLRPVRFATAAAAEEAAQELIQRYLTGSELRGPAPMPWPDIPPSAALFRIVTLIEKMQCPKNPEDQIPAMDLILRSEDQPNNWSALMGWFAELSRGVTDLMGGFQGDRKGS